MIDPGPDSPTLLLLKTDALVEGIHFFARRTAAAGRLESDRPRGFRLRRHGRPAGALPRHPGVAAGHPVAWVEELYRGMGDCLETFGGVLAGGETSSVPPPSAAVISIAATGSVRREHLVLRSTARPGQPILVTGTLGGSLAGKHLNFTPRLAESEWLVAHFKPTAMMDLSDGLAKDLPRLAAASGCGVKLERDQLRSPPAAPRPGAQRW